MIILKNMIKFKIILRISKNRKAQKIICIFLSKHYGTRHAWQGQLVCGIMQSEAIGPIVLSHFYV